MIPCHARMSFIIIIIDRAMRTTALMLQNWMINENPVERNFLASVLAFIGVFIFCTKYFVLAYSIVSTLYKNCFLHLLETRPAFNCLYTEDILDIKPSIFYLQISRTEYNCVNTQSLRAVDPWKRADTQVLVWTVWCRERLFLRQCY